MKRQSFIVLVLVSLFGSPAAEADVAACLQSAYTQLEMNNCTGREYKHVQSEMQRVLNEINARYAADQGFIIALHASQDAWGQLLKMNVEMLYPRPNKQAEYGTVYGMCAGLERIQMTIARIEFLKRWLKGAKPDEACSGSILPETPRASP